MNTIDRPVFVNGTGRCGSTLFFSLLCEHPGLSWISNYTNRYRQLPSLASLSRVRDISWLYSKMNPKWKLTPKPAEANELYTWLTNGEFTQPRLLTAADVTPEARSQYRSCIMKHLKWQGKRRFAQKHTGFPRYAYLKEIFPDGRFIHVLRDGRAVANSMINVSWWDGTLKSWWWGPMDEVYKEELERSDDPPVTLAAIVWKTLVDHIHTASLQLSQNAYMELKYSDLVREPAATMQDVLKFIDLPDSERFRDRIATTKIYDSDEKWQKDLSARQIAILEKSLESHLARLGFD